MKKFITILFIAIACINNLQAQSNYEIRISDALNKSEWFELRRIYTEGADSISPLLKSFAEAMLAHCFCSSDSACKAIDNLTMNYRDEIGLGNATSMNYLKSAHLANLGRYSDAKRVLNNCITSYINSGTPVDYLSEIVQQYEALESIGNINHIDIAGEEIIIPLSIDTIWAYNKPHFLIMINANVNNQPMKILFDTGAGVNVVNRKTAQRLGLTNLNIDTRATGVGGQVTGTYSVAQEIGMGNITIKNVPFQVFDISTGIDSIDNTFMKHLDMVIGVKFMNLFDELQIDLRNKKLYIPHETSYIKENESPNLCGGIEELHIIEAKINNTPMVVTFDTGAANSSLNSPYYQKFKSQIENSYESDTLRQAGAGGVKISKAYKIKNLNIEIGETSYTFPEIAVPTTSDNPSTLYGCMGMDYFINFSKIIFDFKNHILRIEK